LPQGTIKDYDPRSRTGTLFMDDESEVHIDATSVEGAGIRILRIGQRVKFDVAEVSGKKMARTLRIVTFD
jgi:cold shock CspA family protein